MTETNSDQYTDTIKQVRIDSVNLSMSSHLRDNASTAMQLEEGDD